MRHLCQGNCLRGMSATSRTLTITPGPVLRVTISSSWERGLTSYRNGVTVFHETKPLLADWRPHRCGSTALWRCVQQFASTKMPHQGRETSPIQKRLLPGPNSTSYLRTKLSVPSARILNTAKPAGTMRTLFPSRTESDT